MNKLAHCLDEGVSPQVVRGMRDQIDLLEEQVRQYREAAESTPPYPAEWSLTSKEARLVGTLVRARGNVVSTPRLMVALYGLEADVEPKIIDVFVCKVRKKFRTAGIGITIKTRWGEGFLISASDADRLRDLAPDHAVPQPGVTAGLHARIAELEADNARLAAELDAAVAQAAAIGEMVAETIAKAEVPPIRARRTWRDLAAVQAKTPSRAGAGLRGGGVSRQSQS